MPQQRVGFIGLGIMGSRMAANLRRAGFELTVWNRTTATAEAWAAEHGATVAETPAALAAVVDTVITMVVDADQVEAVLLGEHGVAAGAGGGAGANQGLLCVDCSTIGATAARRIGAALAHQRLRFVDAPVTGTSPRAQDGTLTIMAGGDPADVAQAHPLFEAMGELIVHVGPLGQGQMVKLINNALAAVNTAAVAQALIVADAAGVDLDALERVVGSGSGGSAMLALKAGPMRAHDYSTLFKLEHMLKDVRLCLEEGQAVGAPFPYAADVRETLNAAIGRGHGQDDFAALVAVLEGAAGRRLGER